MMSQEEIQKAVEGVMALRPAGTKPRTKKKKPSPSFSRTRQSLYPRAPSSPFGNVLTATTIPPAA
ncbi:hypothetical protein [Vibrio vulnificus]|uniref:hypothetical protein n=1 Tax=Vibrio vulnificus TaxID=672 RepID=UPI0024E006BB|nr:hypothetical protein [Vibrio vulnificus]MDK2679639.1 hypothetical protein [Vibrio vulnificus]